MKTFLTMVGFILSVGLVGGGSGEAGGPKVPAFELRSLDGKLYSDQDLIGQPTLLMFWASWCHVCQGELPKVHGLQEQMKGKKFQILAIGFADPEANIRDYVASHPTHFNFPVLYDTGDRVASQFGVRSTPTFFLLNKKGEVVIPYRGGGLLEHPQFQATLSQLLNEG
ncbi:MAG: TlpA family protein disulfide reductase [Nitrospirales bacterium]|nr:TlpA family protein disulfide reductase [Nitrospirales bacterium]